MTGITIMKRPWIPFWPVDYLADTQHLSTVQHGAYLLLILHYWTHEGLPDDDRELARITKLPLNSWRAMQTTIQQFFHDGWQHKRIDADLVKVGLVVEQRKRAGSIGGTNSAIARWNGKQTLKQNVSKRSSKTASKTQANVKLLEEDITTNLSVAARARDKNPAISDTGENQQPESVEKNQPSQSTNTEAAATKKSGPAMKASGAGTSAELLDLVAAKGWAP